MRAPAIALAAIGLLGCSVRPFRWEPEGRWAIRSEIAAARRQVGLRRLLDSLPAKLASAPPGPVVVLGPSGTEHPDSGAVRRLGARWAAAADSARPLRLVLWIYRPTIDSAPLDGSTGPVPARPQDEVEGSLPPEVTDGRTCVVVEPAGPQWREAAAEDGLVAPCLFRARFGAPGIAMAGWLRSTGYAPLWNLRWLAGLAPERGERTGESGFERIVGTFWKDPAMLLYAWRGLKGDFVPYWDGPGLLRCLAGVESACGDALQDSPWRRPRPRGPTGFVPRLDGLDRFDWFSRSVWMSELIRTKGSAKFGAWWRSTEDFESGFERVYGVSLARSVAQFVERERAIESRPSPIRLGTGIAPVQVAVSAAWLALILALPLLVARRFAIRR